MLIRLFRDYLLPASAAIERARRAPKRARGARFFRPSHEALEVRRLLAVSPVGDEPVAAAVSPAAETVAQVVGRYVFYNGSRFDGHDASANVADDSAIAVDKRALLPGQTVTFANYTSYSAGINGLMIDIAGLRGTPTASDFLFFACAGNDPGTWTDAPAPTSITVRPGAGVDGSSRVTILWPDHAIENCWLEVAVQPTSNIPLPQTDVFFFGNLVGSAGAGGEPVVSHDDELVLRDGAFTFLDPASVIARYDYNRDGFTNATDRVIARNRLGNALARIAPVGDAGGISPAEQDSQSDPEGAGASSSWPAETAYTDFVQAEVVARHIFHNTSSADGFDPAANAADDLAIEWEISALLPGDTATGANYVKRFAGINGVMIDVLGLAGTPTVDDFEFLMGNSDDPSTWVTAPAPTSIAMRQGAGESGAARITLTWPDGAMKNTWLQVTVRTTERTGLQAPDVFYFGHISSTLPAVHSPFRSRDDRYDEQLLLRSFTAPNVAVGQPEPVRQQPELFAPGDANFAVSFSPSLARAVDGTLLAFAQGRYGFDDQMSHALNMRRSTDDGATWSATETIFSVAPNSVDIVGSPAPIVDEVTGEIFLLFTLRNLDVYVMSSADNGLTWSSPTDITSDVKVTASGNPNPTAFPSDPWGWIAIGPGHGIQINNGPYAGRLIIGGDHRLSSDRHDPSWSHVTYSDDHGQTWHLGGGLDQTNPANDHSNEATLVETADGSLYMGIRVNENEDYTNIFEVRGFSRSYDGGATWTQLGYAAPLTTFPVHGSLLRVNDNTIIFSAPDSDNGERQKVTIWVSHDDGASWSKTKAVTYDYAGYSDMVLVGPDTVLIAYNAGHTDGFSADYISLARFNLNWLLDEQPAQFTWHFNEEDPGTQTNILGTTILDTSPWDIRSAARADTEAEAPLYVAGPHAGDSALALTEGSDYVQLTARQSRALQFDSGESFTVELTMRTTDDFGAVIGTFFSSPNWFLTVDNGFLKLGITVSTQVYSTVSSTTPINDGQWHQIAVVRNAATAKAEIYIDGTLSAVGYAPTGKVRNPLPVTLGAVNDGTWQLAFEIDTLRVTRDVVEPGDFLAASYAAPPRFEAAPFPADAPNSIDGLQFWLTSYDPTRFYSGLLYSDPMSLNPVSTTATQSAYDASGNQFKVTTISESREVRYAYDPVVGANWDFDSPGPTVGNQWVVQNPDNAGISNFDFVQNTGVFTLSAFIKPDTTTGSYMSLFDTSQASSAYSGFDLSLLSDGSLGLNISGPSGTVRFNQTTPTGLISQDEWYHVVAVGNGPGQPVTFYVTPASDATVVAYQSAGTIFGANGTYPSDAGNPLTIGALAGTPNAAYNGYMVDQAIFDRALSEQEVQQLFDYTKKM